MKCVFGELILVEKTFDIFRTIFTNILDEKKNDNYSRCWVASSERTLLLRISTQTIGPFVNLPQSSDNFVFCYQYQVIAISSITFSWNQFINFCYHFLIPIHFQVSNMPKTIFNNEIIIPLVDQSIFIGRQNEVKHFHSFKANLIRSFD